MSDTQPKSTGPAPAHGPKKVFDISRPGKVPASPTSRPIITSHKAPAADDQFVSKAGADDTEHDRPALKHKELGLKPSPTPAEEEKSQSSETSPEVPPAATVAQTTTSTESTAEPTQDQPTDEPETSYESEEKTAPELDADAMPVTPESTSPKPKPSPAPEEETLPEGQSVAVPEPAKESQRARPMTHEDVLAETSAPMLEQVIVSHHKAHRTKLWEWLLIFILMLIVAAAALNFLLDAEVLKTNMDIPHTDWLK